MKTTVPPKYKDYYDLLGLNRDEDLKPEKIKKAFMAKAMLWHPDKAPTTEDVPIFTKVYEDLQQAYKILSNEDARKQYATAQQATNLDLTRVERDLSYDRPDQYTVYKETGTMFDIEKFISDFENTRNKEDRKIIDELVNKTAAPVTRSEFDRFIAERDKDLHIDNIFKGDAKFDTDLFNQAFDYVKKTNPARELEECIGEPTGMGLAELDQGFSGVNFDKCVTFANTYYEGLDIGVTFNPTSLNLDMFKASGSREGAGSNTQKLSFKESDDRIKMIQRDRARLFNLSDHEYSRTPTDMKTLFPHLFATKMEELPSGRT